MKPTLVTGGTGIVGYAIIEALRARGREVRALVRSMERAEKVLPGVVLVEGDVTEPADVRRAMEGCGVVYHAAGLPESFQLDPGIFERVNVGGTRNVVAAALELGIDRLVYTSTIDVFQAVAGQEYDEGSPIATEPKGTAYERSKQEADRIVAEAVAERGLDAIFLHPAAVYGPGPDRPHGANQLFLRLRDGKAPALLPGGMPLVFSRDVGEGHVLAEEKAETGARYILSEPYQELQHIARVTANALGRERIPPVLPPWLARIVAALGETLGRWLGRAPLVTRGELHFLQWRARPRNYRARRELGWHSTLLRDGVRKTLAFFAGEPEPESEAPPGKVRG